MKIDFPGLEAFVSVAELGSFTRAARQLNLSQTAVTHRISKLEKRLGARLLQRSTREVVLTREGSELLPRLKAILADLDGELRRVSADLETAQAPQLTIACLPTIAMDILPEALKVFKTSNPQVVVKAFDTSATEIAPLVTQGIAEIGLTILAAGNKDLATEPLFTEDYLLVCPADHPLGGRRDVRWAQIKGQPLVRVNQHTANRFIVDEALGAESERMNWAYEVQHTLTAVRLVQAGLGLTIMPRCAVDALRTEPISFAPLIEPKITRTIGLLSKRGTELSPLAQRFRIALFGSALPDRPLSKVRLRNPK